jgi:hypothetical protein
LSQQGTGGLEVRIGNTAKDITPFVKRFIWSESLIAGGFSWKATFSTEEWSEWNDLLLGAADPEWRFRLKVQEDQTEKTTDWRRAITDTSKAGFRGVVMFASAEGADKRLVLRQKVRTRAHANASVADVARKIAQEYDLTPVLDDTAGAPARDRWQIREDDWTYLVRLNAESATTGGRGDSFVWVDEDTLRMGAPKIAGIPADRRHVMSEIENRVDRHVVSYAGRAIDRAGGATLIGVGYDFDAGAPVSFKLDRTASQTHPGLARRVPRQQDEGLRVIPITESARALVEGVTRARWGKVAPRYFSLRVDTRPDVLLRPGAMLEMDANLDERRQTPLHGRFVVLEVVHEMIDSSIRTSAVCFRREAYEGEEEPAGASAASGGSRDRYRTDQTELPRVVLVAEEIPG